MATTSLRVKDQFGDANCFFLRVAEILLKVVLLLIIYRHSTQEGQKLQKAAVFLFVQEEIQFQLLFSSVRCV